MSNSGHTNITAFSQGVGARIDDEQYGNLTDNPYTPNTMAFESWYKGYNDEPLIDVVVKTTTPIISPHEGA